MREHDRIIRRIAHLDDAMGELDKVDLVVRVDVRDDDATHLGGGGVGDGVGHRGEAFTAGDATSSVNVKILQSGAGTRVHVHVGAEGHSGRDFATVEC